jgi:hypothetical protein
MKNDNVVGVIGFEPTTIRLGTEEEIRKGSAIDHAAMKVTVRVGRGTGNLLAIVRNELKRAKEAITNNPEQESEFLKSYRVPRTFARSFLEFEEFIGIDRQKMVYQVQASNTTVTFHPVKGLEFQPQANKRAHEASGLTYRWKQTVDLSSTLTGGYYDRYVLFCDMFIKPLDQGLVHCLVNMEKATYELDITPYEGPARLVGNLVTEITFTLKDARD